MGSRRAARNASASTPRETPHVLEARRKPVFTHTLSSPIQYLGVPIYEIAVREPTGGDLFRVGNPVKFDPRDNSIEFDDVKAIAMLSRLSGIPIEGSLERATPSDLVECFWGMAGFFMPGMRRKPEAEPAETSPSPS